MASKTLTGMLSTVAVLMKMLCSVYCKDLTASDFERYRAKEAWRFLQGESPWRVRPSQPPVSSLASSAEWGKEGGRDHEQDLGEA